MHLTRKIGNKIFRFQNLDSTNAVMKEMLQEGLSHGAVITAETQASGRGRLERRWESPEGGLWLSVLLELDQAFDAERLGLIPLIAGASVATAIIMETELDAGLKWPNDVLVNGRKVCGILAELVVMGERRFVIVGIGINVNNRMREGYDFSDVSTSLAEEFGKKISMEVLENAIFEELDFRFELLANREYGTLLEDWKGLSETIGRNVNVIMPGREMTGMAVDVDVSGSLILDMDGITEVVNVGDCRHLE